MIATLDPGPSVGFTSCGFVALNTVQLPALSDNCRMQNLHRRWVANHLKHKTRELRYFLELIADGSLKSRQAFRSQQPAPDEASQFVIYGFSGFTNAVLSLKDSFETATGHAITWSKIGKLRHGTFVKEARNAATHDGNPIVNGRVDGEYYTLGKIIRFNAQDKVVAIIPPPLPILQVCAEFGEDLCALISQELGEHIERNDLVGAIFTEDMLNDYYDSPLIPEFAKDLLRRDRDYALAAIARSTHDPVQEAIAELDQVASYCRSCQGQAKC